MNKIVFMAVVCGLLFACQQPTNKKVTEKVVETEEKRKLQLVYSNLVDTESQQEVQQALAAAGVSTKNIGDHSMMKLQFRASGRVNILFFKAITVE